VETIHILEAKMYKPKLLNHNVATIGEGALLVWWGIVLMFDPLTIGMGAIGTGLILLSINGARLLSGLPTRRTTTILGMIAFAWGLLEVIFNPSFGGSLALLLIVIGLATIASLLVRQKNT
jgi:hypothetical protein